MESYQKFRNLFALGAVTLVASLIGVIYAEKVADNAEFRSRITATEARQDANLLQLNVAIERLRVLAELQAQTNERFEKRLP